MRNRSQRQTLKKKQTVGVRTILLRYLVRPPLHRVSGNPSDRERNAHGRTYPVKYLYELGDYDINSDYPERFRCEFRNP